VGTYYAATEPTCGNDDGEIQMHVTGGSGLYLFKVNEKPYTYYEGGLITGLEAGTYTIKVKDSVQKDCSEVVINNIVLRNGDTDLFASMSSENAQTCVSTDGILNVTVTGGKMPYTYYLNDKENEVVVINGKITGQKAGVYVLNVKDGNDCWTSSGEVHIFADNSNIDVLVEVKKEAFCGSSTGAIQFTVYNSANYTYQIDGFSEGTGSGTTPVIVTGLSAGLHYLRITDDCGELVIDFTITNGTNGLLFTAVPTNETLSCEGELLPGSISLTVNYGMPNYKYRVDGGAWISFAANSNTAIIDNLHSGVYHVEVKDTTGCTYQVNNVAIERETSHGTLITAPVATSPQTFCSSAKVENLQATGVNIKWYLTPTGGNAINPATLLMDTIYYAAQTFGTCESGVRTAVRVILDDDAILEVPEIKTPQALCNSGSLKISDIATNGNTNIVWYENETGGNPLALTAPLAAKKYYATVKAGNCQSAPRIPIVITFTTNNPSAPEIESPQYFCEGAMIGNIAVPNNQILWYNANGELLSAEHLLVHNGKYYAEQKAGSCYSSSRTEVTVQLTAPLAPEMPEKQGICGKATLADLLVTGAGIVWYNAPMYGDKLPLSTELHVGYDYWAAQSSMGDCEGARAKVTITDSCYTVYGTMFPFVYDEGATEFNAEFPVSVKLYAVPAKDGNNPILSILSAGALYTTQAVYYDGTIHIPGTPKDPGSIGAFDNPGETINWDDIGKTPGTPDNTPVAAKGDFPDPPVGMFKFENVKPGSYILEIYRKGYIIRWGEVEIDKHGMSLGHRELIAGDINDDLVVDFADLSWTNAKNASYPDALYDSRFDLNGDGNVDGEDIQILMNNFGAYMGTYEETFNWVNGY